jgi:excisionase family DNA binding protein
MANLPPIPPAADRLLLRPREAAYLLGCSVSMLYKRVADGVIPHHYEGRRLVFFRQELEAYVASLPGTTLEAAQAQRQRLKKLRGSGDTPPVSPPPRPILRNIESVAETKARHRAIIAEELAKEGHA